MATVSLKVEGLSQALKELDGEVQDFLTKADRKFKVAGARMEAYAKANAPVNKQVGIGGFHRRNIKHNPAAPFLTTSLTAFAEYASVLEFGFFGLVGVRAHTREIAQAFGREIPRQTINVGAHVRPMNRPARPHLVPAGERALRQLVEDLEGL